MTPQAQTSTLGQSAVGGRHLTHEELESKKQEYLRIRRECMRRVQAAFTHTSNEMTFTRSQGQLGCLEKAGVKRGGREKRDPRADRGLQGIQATEDQTAGIGTVAEDTGKNDRRFSYLSGSLLGRRRSTGRVSERPKENPTPRGKPRTQRLWLHRNANSRSRGMPTMTGRF